MGFVFLIVFCVAFAVSVCFRLAVSHPFLTSFYSFKDIRDYFKYKKWRLCNSADLICFTGLFGKGKTLSAVHRIISMYKTYDNKKVYDFSRKMWVTQKVLVLSNVRLNIPFEYLSSLSQVVAFTERQKKIDLENGLNTILFVLIDEASVQLNSRSFKDNIDSNFLNTLLCSRHYNIKGIYLTSQRFKLCDKLLRDVTQTVIDCKKVWRFEVLSFYDAWEVENASNLLLVQPLRRSGFFIRDSDFDSYDTYATVETLKKSCAKGDMLSEKEILSLRCNQDVNVDAVSRPSRILSKMRKSK